MIVEVLGGARSVPEARVVDVDNLTALHLALGEVTDEEAAEVLERAGLGRFHDSDTVYLDVAALHAAAAAARDRRRLADAVGRDGRQGPQQAAGCRRTARPCRCTWRAPPEPDGAGVHPLERHARPDGVHCSSADVIVVTPSTGHDVAVRMTSRHGILVMTGTPGRPLSAELSEQLLSVAVDILAEEGWGRLNSDRIAARARAGKAGIYRRWPTMAALARHAIGRFSPGLRRRRTAARCARTSSPSPSAGPIRWTARSAPWPASSGPPGTRRSCGRVSTPRSCDRSRRPSTRSASAPCQRGEPIEPEPARAARLGARGLLVAALHGGRRRRDDRRTRSSAWWTTS